MNTLNREAVALALDAATLQGKNPTLAEFVKSANQAKKEIRAMYGQDTLFPDEVPALARRAGVRLSVTDDADTSWKADIAPALDKVLATNGRKPITHQQCATE